VWIWWLDSYGSGYCPTVSFCEHGTEKWGSITAGNSLTSLPTISFSKWAVLHRISNFMLHANECEFIFGEQKKCIPKSLSKRCKLYYVTIPLRLKCIWIIYKNPVRTSQETHYASATNTKRLMPFRETIAVYENIQTREYTPWTKEKVNIWYCVTWRPCCTVRARLPKKQSKTSETAAPEAE
jgi:hypothetical protein